MSILRWVIDNQKNQWYVFFKKKSMKSRYFLLTMQFYLQDDHLMVYWVWNVFHFYDDSLQKKFSLILKFYLPLFHMIDSFKVILFNYIDETKKYYSIQPSMLFNNSLIQYKCILTLNFVVLNRNWIKLKNETNDRSLCL